MRIGRKVIFITGALLLICCSQGESYNDAKKPIVVFRLDDIRIDDKMDLQKRIIELFIDNDIPITISVIPSWKGQEIQQSILGTNIYGMINEGKLEIAQHGFNSL